MNFWNYGGLTRSRILTLGRSVNKKTVHENYYRILFLFLKFSSKLTSDVSHEDPVTYLRFNIIQESLSYFKNHRHFYSKFYFIELFSDTRFDHKCHFQSSRVNFRELFEWYIFIIVFILAIWIPPGLNGLWELLAFFCD